MEPAVRAHAVITGRVQGVCFRMETKRAAKKYNVYGWVKNRPDGSVEAVFEGDRNNVDAILRWCHQGPPMSRVDAVDVSYEDSPEGYSQFMITY